MLAEAVGAFGGGVFRVGRGGGRVRAGFVIPGAHIAPGGFRRAMMGGVPPSHANAALPGCRRDRPGLAAPRNRVERHIGLEESFSGRGGAVVGDFDEDGGGESDGLACRNDETWLLNEFHRLPLGVARNGLEQPLVSDCSAVRMTSRHKCIASCPLTSTIPLPTVCLLPFLTSFCDFFPHIHTPTLLFCLLSPSSRHGLPFGASTWPLKAKNFEGLSPILLSHFLSPLPRFSCPASPLQCIVGLFSCSWTLSTCF